MSYELRTTSYKLPVYELPSYQATRVAELRFVPGAGQHDLSL